MTEPTPDPAALLRAAADRLRQPIGPDTPAIVAPALVAPLALLLEQTAPQVGPAIDTARDILATAPNGAPQGPQEAATTVGADKETPDARSGAHTGADGLTPAQIADRLDEFIADAAAHGASEGWLRGARCITGRLRLADPAALEDEVVEISIDTSRLDTALTDASVSLAHAALRGRIRAAVDHLRDTGAVYSLDDPEADRITTAVLAVLDRYLEQLAAGRETALSKAREIEADRNAETARADRAEQLATDLRQRVLQAEATVRRVRQMAHAWRDQLPDAISRDTASQALLDATEQYAHLDQP